MPTMALHAWDKEVKKTHHIYSTYSRPGNKAYGTVTSKLFLNYLKRWGKKVWKLPFRILFSYSQTQIKKINKEARSRQKLIFTAAVQCIQLKGSREIFMWVSKQNFKQHNIGY